MVWPNKTKWYIEQHQIVLGETPPPAAGRKVLVVYVLLLQEELQAAGYRSQHASETSAQPVSGGHHSQAALQPRIKQTLNTKRNSLNTPLLFQCLHG